MTDKVIRYKAHGCSIESMPDSITGSATLRVLVETSKGNYHTLLISDVNVGRAKCVRWTANKLCAKFKDLASEMYRSL